MITLQVDGREMTFTEEELTAILEDHFTFATSKRPTEDVPFEVNPLGIDRNLFKKKRKDEQQEKTRQLILEAFTEMDKNPGKYGKSFKTLMPKKTWVWKTVDAHRELATKLGDHMADLVEQFLEWAQRIQNGETWKAICDKADSANWYRLIEWNNGYALLVGGSRKMGYLYPASSVGNIKYLAKDRIYSAVPLIVLY